MQPQLIASVWASALGTVWWELRSPHTPQGEGDAEGALPMGTPKAWQCDTGSPLKAAFPCYLSFTHETDLFIPSHPSCSLTTKGVYMCSKSNVMKTPTKWPVSSWPYPTEPSNLPQNMTHKFKCYFFSLAACRTTFSTTALQHPALRAGGVPSKQEVFQVYFKNIILIIIQ